MGATLRSPEGTFTVRLASSGGPRRERIAGDDERAGEGPKGRRLEGIGGTGSDLSRLLSLSDGVFAFAMTFLAVTLLFPQTSGASTVPSLFAYLSRLEPAFVGYVLSFLVIAAWWNTHHQLFSSIVRYDPVLIRLNSFFLLVISVTPFLVSLLFVYSPDGFGAGSPSSRLAVMLYAAVQALGGLDLLAIWRRATGHRRLVSPSLSGEWIHATEQVQLFTIGVFVGSIAIAFVAPLVAELTWIVMIFGLRRQLWRRARRKPATEEEAHRA